MLTQFKKEISFRLFDECFPRIEQCLGMLSEEQIWLQPNKNSNSVATIIIHICGNVRQYIMHGVAQLEDTRTRDAEFKVLGHMEGVALTQMINKLKAEVQPVIQNISESEILQIRRVQCFDLSVMSILIHVTEHMSYHVGQITYITKMLLDTQTGYYDGKKLG